MTNHTTPALVPVTQADVRRAALYWVGRKERETFQGDIDYFEHNWHALPGMRHCVEAFAQHRIASEKAAYEAGARDMQERAAGVAEDRHEQWRMPHPDDARPGEVCDDISACRDIATAIRAMPLTEEPEQ